MPNAMEQLTLNRAKTSYEQPLPVYLNISPYDNSLSDRPDKLKEFIHDYIQSLIAKRFLICKKGIPHTYSHLTKISFLTKL